MAFMKAMNLLHGVMSVIVPPHHDGHQNGQKSGYMLHHHCVDCRPGGRLGDMERVIARWRRPVASDVTLDMLHQVMPRQGGMLFWPPLLPADETDFN